MTQQQIPDAERIPSQVVEDAIKGLAGKARWETAARVGEDWGYGAGWDAAIAWVLERDRASAFLSHVPIDGIIEAVSSGPEVVMVACPDCGGTGKLWNGSQCKRCYGATVVKAEIEG